MKRQRREISKNFKYVLVCLALIVGELGGVLTSSATLFEVVSLDLIVFVPIFIKRYKYNTDMGSMMISGLIRTARWTALWTGRAFLSRYNPVVDKIVGWPIVPA